MSEFWFRDVNLIFGEILVRTRSSVRQAVAATVLLVLTSAAITSLTATAAYANLCPLTWGFWKNHPNAWPDGTTFTLTLGGRSCKPSWLRQLRVMRACTSPISSVAPV